MKIKSRFGGSLVCMLIMAASLYFGLNKLSSKAKGEFEIVDSFYLKSAPLASIINIPAFTAVTDSFLLEKDTSVHIYGVGELIFNLADAAGKDLFKGDNIVLYLGLDSLKKNTNAVEFEWSELSGKTGIIKKETIEFAGWQHSDGLRKYNTAEIIGKYYAKVKIPLADCKRMNAVTDSGVLFNVAIGNADDEFKLRNKVSLSDSKNLKDGSSLVRIQLCSKDACPSLDSSSINAVYGSIDIDSSFDAAWNKTPVYKINNVHFGEIKGKYDFEALVRFLWDDENLYLFFEIQDMHRQKGGKIDMSKRQTFLDYGWIEDIKGQTIWEMNAAYSKHAGGAFKNQYIDTILFLKKGKYFLNYSSDESHSYNDWDDDPPLTTFYGIKIYK